MSETDESAPNAPENDRSEADTPEPELESAIRKLSENRPEVASEFMAMMAGGPVMNPLYQKMEGEHITQVLELAAAHDERQYNLHKGSQDSATEDRRANKRYLFAIFLVVIGVFLTLLLLFREQPDILIPSLTGLGGLVSGFLGGWGLGRRAPE